MSVVIIGITTGLFSAAGLYIGRAFGSRWQKPAQIAGGVVLILIGLKVLFEHLGFLAADATAHSSARSATEKPAIAMITGFLNT